MLEKIDSREREWDNVEFLGVRIPSLQETRQTTLEIWQLEYIESLHIVPLDIDFDRFRSIQATVGWLSHSRPDICCEINRAALVTEDHFDTKHIRQLNQAISHVRRTADLKLKYGPLDECSLHLRV